MQSARRFRALIPKAPESSPAVFPAEGAGRTKESEDKGNGGSNARLRESVRRGSIDFIQSAVPLIPIISDRFVDAQGRSD